jgi:hypothetical protein
MALKRVYIKSMSYILANQTHLEHVRDDSCSTWGEVRPPLSIEVHRATSTPAECQADLNRLPRISAVV